MDTLTYDLLVTFFRPKPPANTRILHADQNTQKHSCRPTNCRSRGPTECISSFADSLSQPIAQKQESCIKDTTHFVNFIKNTPLSVWEVLVTSTFVHFTLTFRTRAEKRSSLFWTLFKEGHERCCSSWLRNDSRAHRLSHNSVTIGSWIATSRALYFFIRVRLRRPAMCRYK